MHASLKAALADAGQRQVGAINRRMATRFGNAESPAAPPAGVGNPAWLADGRNGWWITGYGSGGGTDATPDTAPMDTALGGVLFGFDRALGKHGGLGLLGGYSNTDVTQSAHASSGAVQSWSAGAYGGAKVGAARLSVGAIYSGHALEARRAVDIADFSNRLAASYQARSWQVFGEAGYQLPIGSLLLEPVGGVSFVSLATDGFSETGGAAALRAAADTADTTFTTLGVRSALELKDKAHARAMVGWRHAFGDTNPASTFTMAGSSPVTTMGAPTAADAVVTELGIDARFTDTADVRHGVPRPLRRRHHHPWLQRRPQGEVLVVQGRERQMRRQRPRLPVNSSNFATGRAATPGRRPVAGDVRERAARRCHRGGHRRLRYAARTVVTYRRVVKDFLSSSARARWNNRTRRRSPRTS